MIDDFRGNWYALSNFSAYRCYYEGLLYRSVEHAFQAAKTLDPYHRQQILMASNPRDAKRLGQQVALRADWEDVKIGIMRGLLVSKFTVEERARTILAKSVGERLVEGNTWHDQFWGDCHCARHLNEPGLNWLGTLLEIVRDELAAVEL